MLQGRRRECEALDRLLQRVRVGESSALVLRGEAGIGKTALLDYVAEQASGCRVARAAGVQSEMELAFAGLHHLCAPLLDGLDALPAPQREALQVAFGLRDGAPPDRFLVALAVLSLLAETAEARPLVCVIDDAQWLDRASALVLAFVARRLLAERVAMVFAVREPADADALAGLPELRVEGLADADARALLASARLRAAGRARARSDRRRDARQPARAAGAAARADAGRAGGRVRAARRAPPRQPHRAHLPAARPVAAARHAAPAAGGGGRTGGRPRACCGARRSGSGSPARPAGPPRPPGLIELGFRVRFKHPLVRSAVYRGAAARDRREVHRALAEATDPVADPDRRAWHAAHATAAPDEVVAADMLRSADRAQRRGGRAAAAAFLERATELTPDPRLRVERALVAAQAKLDVADHAAASELLTAARARPARTRSSAPGWSGCGRRSRSPAGAAATLRRCCSTPPGASSRSTPDGGARDLPRGDRGRGVRRPARHGSGRSRGGPGRPLRAAGDGAPRPAPRRRWPHGSPRATRRAFPAALERAAPFAELDDSRWLWLACRLAQDLWDDELWHVLATRGVRVAREAGALSTLPIVATYLAALHVHAGAFDAASALIDEIDAITQATGIAPLKYAALMLAAWRGDQAQALALLDCGVSRTRRPAAKGPGSACTGGRPRCSTTPPAAMTRRSRPRSGRASTRT